MRKTYSSRKKMLSENFANFDGTTLSRNEAVEYIESLGYEKFYFEVAATSHGLYGTNGAVIHVISDANDTTKTVTSFAILSRSTTLFEFI